MSTFLIYLRQWNTSWATTIPSKIWWASTNHLFSREIILLSRSLRWFAITEEIILYTKLHRKTSWKAFFSSYILGFGIRMRKVDFNLFHTCLDHQDSSIKAWTSEKIKMKHNLKNIYSESIQTKGFHNRHYHNHLFNISTWDLSHEGIILIQVN